MSGFTSFVVAGAGLLGKQVATELAAQPNTTVTVLTRKGSAPKDFPKNVKTAAVDYEDAVELETAIKGHEVVISTLAGPGLAAQPALAKAAKAAGVKHFVPSEFGAATNNLTGGMLFRKKQFQNVLDSLDLPYTLVFIGLFPEYCLVPAYGFDWNSGKVSYPDPGTAPISWTNTSDIAYFLAKYLTHTTTPKKIVRLEGDRKSFAEVVEIYRRIHPSRELEVAVKKQSEYEARLESNPVDFVAFLLLAVTAGHGAIGEAESWAERKPTTVEDILANF